MPAAAQTELEALKHQLDEQRRNVGNLRAGHVAQRVSKQDADAGLSVILCGAMQMRPHCVTVMVRSWKG
jgi:hypothetical protein